MAQPTSLHVKKLHADAALPKQMTPYAAGFDLYAYLWGGEVEIHPGERLSVCTGIAVAIEVGYEGQVRPRSGLALKHGVTILNTPGTIDADYRGEVRVLLVNTGDMPFVIKHGDRIAQLVIAAVPQVEIKEVEGLEPSERGAGGFGSTGGS